MSTEASYEQAYKQVQKRLREVIEENEIFRRGMGQIDANLVSRLSIQVMDLQLENSGLIRERGDLQDAVMKRDEVVETYQRWFRNHEHVITKDDREIRTQKDTFRDFL